MNITTVDEVITKLQEMKLLLGGSALIEAPKYATTPYKTYTFDVRLVGYEQISVQASDLKEAEERARDKFEFIYASRPAWHLRDKTLDLTLLAT